MPLHVHYLAHQSHLLPCFLRNHHNWVVVVVGGKLSLTQVKKHNSITLNQNQLIVFFTVGVSFIRNLFCMVKKSTKNFVWCWCSVRQKQWDKNSQRHSPVMHGCCTIAICTCTCIIRYKIIFGRTHTDSYFSASLLSQLGSCRLFLKIEFQKVF